VATEVKDSTDLLKVNYNDSLIFSKPGTGPRGTGGMFPRQSLSLSDRLKTLANPSGAVITYTPDSAGRDISAVDNRNAINCVTGATYGPDSGLTVLGATGTGRRGTGAGDRCRCRAGNYKAVGKPKASAESAERAKRNNKIAGAKAQGFFISFTARINPCPVTFRG